MANLSPYNFFTFTVMKRNTVPKKCCTFHHFRPEGTWFSSQGIALKTGTQRDIKSRPINSWIVAIGPRDKMGRPSFFAVIHSQGASTGHLLRELKARLEKVTRTNRVVEVGLLNLVPGHLISLSCPLGAHLMERRGLQWDFSTKIKISAKQFEDDKSYKCLGNGFILHFPGAKSKNENRLYFGELKYSRKKQKPTPSSGLDYLREHQVRARENSNFSLITSMRYYLWGVLAAEFPNGREEVLKTLASVARHNIEYYESQGKIICDNTYCQVFGPGQSLPRRISIALDKAVEGALKENLFFPNGKRWLYFSLGGSTPWTKSKTTQSIAEALKLSDLQKIQVDSERIEILTKSGKKSYSCEIFRNQTRLLSCPQSVKKVSDKWIFEGVGAGHGLGVKLQKAQSLAAQGLNYRDILKTFYPEIMFVKEGK